MRIFKNQRYDEESDEVILKLSDDFKKCPECMRCDILSDVLDFIEEEYEKAVRDFNDSMAELYATQGLIPDPLFSPIKRNSHERQRKQRRADASAARTINRRSRATD